MCLEVTRGSAWLEVVSARTGRSLGACLGTSILLFPNPAPMVPSPAFLGIRRRFLFTLTHRFCFTLILNRKTRAPGLRK